MEKRCDGNSNCKDESDEKECEKIKSFEGYNKLFVPQHVEGQSKFQLKISISIEKILSINEFEGKFRGFGLILIWNITI